MFDRFESRGIDRLPNGIQIDLLAGKRVRFVLDKFEFVITLNFRRSNEIIKKYLSLLDFAFIYINYFIFQQIKSL